MVLFCSYLSVGLDEGPSPGGVHLVAAVRAQVDPGTQINKVISDEIRAIRPVIRDKIGEIHVLTSSLLEVRTGKG